MKALILAAGLGTRLRPYTEHTPKPLFTVSNRTLLEITIVKLIKAGCSSVFINTHHLHKQIEAFVAGQTFDIPVRTRHEPQILGTGGAIKNVSDFWNDQPFMVVNADIVSEIDFKQVYHFHCRHSNPATLVLTDNAEFNSVACNSDDFVTGFFQGPSDANQHASSALTFTGIQVLDPVMLDYIPDVMPSSSIDAYSCMLAEGKKIKAYILKNTYWNDVGTPERYKAAVYETMAPRVFQRVFPDQPIATPRRQQIKGDGSDRRWFRLDLNQKTMILADHGIKEDNRVDAADAFFNIGRHLFDKGIAVPQIYNGDTLSGYVFVEDLGTLDLQTAVGRAGTSQKVICLYQDAIKELIQFSQQGARDFDPAWCYQTARYSKSLILEKECRYFVEAFLNTYLGLDYQFADFRTEFELLAESALQHAVLGLMHRDFQSRNIMIRDNRPVLIDFQGARMGPLQYDLASLLIDPYVDLAPDIKFRLLQYCLDQLAGHMVVKTAEFRRSYRYCCLARNLQILGAFGYLTRVKGKPHFELYIPTAVRTLSDSLKQKEHENLPLLRDVMDSIQSRLTDIEKRKD